MRVLALYSNDDSEAQSAIVTLTSAGADYDLGLGYYFNTQNGPDKIAAELPYYNPGGGLFLVALPDEGERPDVVDQDGNEVVCLFFEVDLSHDLG